MRIGFDGRWYNQSGVGSYVLHLLRELALLDQSEHEFIIYESPDNQVPVEGSRIRKVAVTSGKYSPAAQLELALRCRRDRLHVFHAPFYIIPFLACCPVVVTIHDLIPFLFPIYGRAHLELVKFGYRCAVRRSDQIVSVSQTTANDLYSILGVSPERISVVHNGVQHDIFRPGHDPKELEYLRQKYGLVQPYVLTLSASNWHTKNLDTALMAIKGAQQIAGVGFQTVVAGPPQGLHATGLASAIDNLKVLGFVDSADLPMLYRHARVFVSVSRYEGFGLPLLEAMASGSAAVTSTGGSLPEIAADAVACYHVDDAQGMASEIATLLCDPHYHQSRVARSVQRAAEFSYQRTALRMLSVYKQAAQR